MATTGCIVVPYGAPYAGAHYGAPPYGYGYPAPAYGYAPPAYAPAATDYNPVSGSRTGN